jgi:hypothetical protein
VKLLAIADRYDLLLSVSTHAANHQEVTLVGNSVSTSTCWRPHQSHLIGDRAYHRDGLDDKLKQDGTDMIASPPGYTQTYNTRWPTAAALPTALVGGAVLQLVAVEAPVADSLGILRHQLIRIRVARVDHNAAQTISR